MHYYKLLGTDHRHLWENREALEKYLARLKEFWDEEKQEWLPSSTDFWAATPEFIPKGLPGHRPGFFVDLMDESKRFAKAAGRCAG